MSNLISRFSSDIKLYSFVTRLNLEQARFCLGLFSRELSEAIDDRLDSFRQHYETIASLEAQASSFLSFHKINENLDPKMDRVVHNWSSMLIICQRIQSMGAQTIFEHHLESG